MPIGIDLGSHSIKVVRIEGATKDGVKISDFVIRELESSATEDIVAELEEILSSLSTSRDDIAASIPSQKALLREMMIGFTDENLIAKIVKSETETFLHEKNLEEVIVNYYKCEEIGEQSKLLISSIDKKNVGKTLEIYQEAHIDPQSIDMDLTALYGYLSGSGALDDDKVQIVVDIGQTSVKILLVVDGVLKLMRSMHFRSLPQWMESESEESKVKEDSYEAFMNVASNRLKQRAAASASTSTSQSTSTSSTQSTSTSSTLSQSSTLPSQSGGGSDPAATQMFEIFQEDEDEDLTAEDLDELGVESGDDIAISFSGEWDFEDLDESDDELMALAEDSGDDTEFMVLDSEIVDASDTESERVPIAILSDDEFKALEIYDDFEEVSESDLDQFYRRIFQEIDRSLIYSGIQRPLDEIILTGGGSQIFEIDTHFETHFEVPTHLADLPREYLPEKHSKSEFLSRGLVAAGLAAKALPHSRFDPARFDFRKEDFEFEKKYEKVKKTLAMTLFLIFLILFIGFEGLRKELNYIRFKKKQVRQNQYNAFKTLFQDIAPKEEPLYAQNIPASMEDKINELRREFGQGIPNAPKITSALRIFLEISRAKRRSGVQFKLKDISISQNSVQVTGKLSSSLELQKLSNAFSQSDLVQVNGSNYNQKSNLGNLRLSIKKKKQNR